LLIDSRQGEINPFSNGPRADAYGLRDGLRRLPALDLQYNPLSTARRQPGILMHVHPVLRWNLKLQQPQLPRSMSKHDPPGDDAALLELERKLMELDRAIRLADENREAINYALFDRRDELMASIFNTPAAGLEGLAVQARAYLSEHEFPEGERDEPLDFSHMGAVLAHGILSLAHPVVGQAR